MKKRPLRLLLLLLCLIAPLSALGGEVLPPREYDFTHKAYMTYDSETLKYRIETFKIKGVRSYLVKLWMQDPARQIRKATADWKENIQLPSAMAKKIPNCILAINGSGYVSPVYPWIPENYPGDNPDYYYTPLGSLTMKPCWRPIPPRPGASTSSAPCSCTGRSSPPRTGPLPAGPPGGRSSAEWTPTTI